MSKPVSHALKSPEARVTGEEAVLMHVLPPSVRRMLRQDAFSRELDSIYDEVATKIAGSSECRLLIGALGTGRAWLRPPLQLLSLSGFGFFEVDMTSGQELRVLLVWPCLFSAFICQDRLVFACPTGFGRDLQLAAEFGLSRLWQPHLH